MCSTITIVCHTNNNNINNAKRENGRAGERERESENCGTISCLLQYAINKCGAKTSWQAVRPFSLDI